MVRWSVGEVTAGSPASRRVSSTNGAKFLGRPITYYIWIIFWMGQKQSLSISICSAAVVPQIQHHILHVILEFVRSKLSLVISWDGEEMGAAAAADPRNIPVSVSNPLRKKPRRLRFTGRGLSAAGALNSVTFTLLLLSGFCSQSFSTSIFQSGRNRRTIPHSQWLWFPSISTSPEASIPPPSSSTTMQYGFSSGSHSSCLIKSMNYTQNAPRILNHWMAFLSNLNADLLSADIGRFVYAALWILFV